MAGINSPEEAKAFIIAVSETCDAIWNLKQVTIARIDGLCFGAGLELAACCDFRFGTKRSKFSMKEVLVGIPSVVHARLLVGIVGWQVARRLVLLGEELDGNDAGRVGLLDGMYEDVEGLQRRVDEAVGMLAAYGKKTVQVQKELVKEWERVGVREGIDAGVYSFASMWEDGGAEPKKYMGNFLGRKRSRS
jgi:enoyl-CoA hydratase/carnithine racemase